MTELAELSLAEASRGLQQSQFRSTDLTEACLTRIKRWSLGAFLHVAEEAAMAAAFQSDHRRSLGQAIGPLDGIPIALKDLLITEDMPTTAASKILEGWLPPYDGTIAQRLRACGSVLIGKTNLDEFAMGSSNEHSAFGPTKNPWDPSKVAGGSSGGSAAALAAGQCMASLGTDTGGSIRQPAAFCGVLGLKPTYGRVSRSGVVAFASSLDQVGPMGRSAEDIALLMNAIAGYDPLDSTSSQAPTEDYLKQLNGSLEGLRLGIPREYFETELEPEVETTVRTLVRALEGLGVTTKSVTLPHTQFALSTYYILCTAEASSNLARYDGVRYGHRTEDSDLRSMMVKTRFEGFGDEVKRRIILGTYVLSAGYRDAYYERAQRARTLIRRDFESAFGDCDILLSPTTPTAAFGLKEKLDNPLTMYAADVLTLAVNLAGIPGLSMPAGFTSTGLPIGAQLMGPWFEEARLLRAAHALERITDHHRKRPEFSDSAGLGIPK